MAKEYIFKLDYALYNEETGEAVFKPKVVCELIRCRECKYYEDECCWREIQFINAPEPNDFCSYGERKEQDDARTD